MFLGSCEVTPDRYLALMGHFLTRWSAYSSFMLHSPIILNIFMFKYKRQKTLLLAEFNRNLNSCYISCFSVVITILQNSPEASTAETFDCYCHF